MSIITSWRSGYNTQWMSSVVHISLDIAYIFTTNTIIKARQYRKSGFQAWCNSRLMPPRGRFLREHKERMEQWEPWTPRQPLDQRNHMGIIRNHRKHTMWEKLIWGTYRYLHVHVHTTSIVFACIYMYMYKSKTAITTCWGNTHTPACSTQSPGFKYSMIDLLLRPRHFCMAEKYFAGCVLEGISVVLPDMTRYTYIAVVIRASQPAHYLPCLPWRTWSSTAPPASAYQTVQHILYVYIYTCILYLPTRPAIPWLGQSKQ